jgi:hypothetical protein
LDSFFSFFLWFGEIQTITGAIQKKAATCRTGDAPGGQTLYNASGEEH